jgi:hypothetical protein
MAVSVDTVYQRVLGILNKEQRGYVTPQEFNLFANQAQLDIFEQYFYDINQFGRVAVNSTEYSDMLTLLNEKINLFETTASMAYSGGYFILPSNLYRLGTIIYTNTTTNPFGVTSNEDIEVERINKNEFLYINSSPLTKPKNIRPIYIADTNGIKAYGNITLTTGIKCNYIKKPAKVQWGYQMVYGEALYDSTISQNFEVHASEETDLVIKILALAGLVTKDPDMYTAATQEDALNTQQEKS